MRFSPDCGVHRRSQIEPPETPLQLDHPQHWNRIQNRMDIQSGLLLVGEFGSLFINAGGFGCYWESERRLQEHGLQ
jgi:hypothetical protein